MAIVIEGAHSRRLIRATLPAALALVLANTAFAQDTDATSPTPQDTPPTCPTADDPNAPCPASANTISLGLRFRL